MLEYLRNLVADCSVCLSYVSFFFLLAVHVPHDTGRNGQTNVKHE